MKRIFALALVLGGVGASLGQSFSPEAFEMPEVRGFVSRLSISPSVSYDKLFRYCMLADVEDGGLWEALLKANLNLDPQWRWYAENPVDDYYNEPDGENCEIVETSYPVSLTYLRYNAAPQLRVINGIAYDGKGNLVRVLDFWAYPVDDYRTRAELPAYRDFFDQHASDPMPRALLAKAFQENLYNIQSRSNHITHYIKTQVGLESLTQAEKHAQSRAASSIARDVRDYAKAGNTRRGRAVKRAKTGSMLRTLTSGNSYYSEDGAAWITQVLSDYWNLMSQDGYFRSPYSIERLSDTSFRITWAGLDGTPLIVANYEYKGNKPYSVKPVVTINSIKLIESDEGLRAPYPAKVKDAEELRYEIEQHPDVEQERLRMQKYAEEKIYQAVEQPAEFRGGMSALMSWLSKNVKYPETAEKNRVSGRVTVQFIIRKDGSITDATILKSVDPDLDAEALRVVQSMPKWHPGKNNGNPVNSFFRLPITFKLQN